MRVTPTVTAFSAATISASSDAERSPSTWTSSFTTRSSCRPHLQCPDQPLAIPHRLALHDEGLAVDDDPVARPRVRHLGDADVEARRLRPEPRAAELGDGVRPPGDDADGDRLPVRRLLGRVPPEVRIGEQPVDEAGEGGHRSEAPLSRTRPTISSAPAPTASTATPMSVLPEATFVTRFAVLSQ